MATSDFSQIVELQEFRRLYEEQEEKVKIRLGEKDEVIEQLNSRISDRDDQMEALRQQIQSLQEEQERMGNDYGRLKQEAQEKIDKLMERIRQLNQRLINEPESSGGKKSGIFR